MHFENFSFFIKVSDEEKFLLLQYGEINGKLAMFVLLLCLMQECGFMIISIQIGAIEERKWSVTMNICSFPYIGKSKELDYVRKSAHEVISGSNHPL